MNDEIVREDKGQCIRCGTCCDQGGPGLHTDDRVLIKQNLIPLDHLYSIRAGERIRDNVNGGFIYLDTELIKLRSHPETTRCRLYLPESHACSIYNDRPAQCRAMKCWDTSAIINLYARDRMQRYDLFGTTPGLWDLIESHEEKCSYREILELTQKRSEGDRAAVGRLGEIFAYDKSLREVVSEKMGVDELLLDLIFGRPLKQTLPAQFGIRLSS